MAYLPVLFRIQEIESRLMALKKVAEQSSSNANLLALETLRGELEQSLNTINNKQKKISSTQKQMEISLQDCQEHLKTEETKLYDGSVSTSKGLEQIQQKAAEYRKNKENYEDQILSLLETDEKLNQDRVGLQKRLQACNDEIGLIKEEVNRKLAEIAFEEKQLQTELEELIPQIPTDWWERYRKIAKSHFGVGLARIKAGSCGACHVGLSDNLLRKAKQGEDALIFCENCGRILYF